MFPMISTIEEVHRAKECVHQVQAELKAAGIPFDPKMKIGVMIEVPSAALMAEHIAEEVDFLSIGTNDLTQYMMAVDRGNDSVAALYQPFNPAVVRMIHFVVEAAHRKHKWVGICGEMAGDPVATVLFVGLGVDELSVIPPVLPEIKKIIRSIRQRDAHRVAEKVLMMSGEREIREYLSSITRTRVPEIPLEEQ
jgi:phosphotransferase system enzyme I (PtsI)